MSKKKNYSKMYASEEEQTTPVEETVTAEEETVEQPVKAKKPKMAKGVVCNCGRLNVREHPDTKATVLCELPVSSKVKVDMSNKYDDWYHVVTETGVEGYCMKQFIQL